MLRTGSSMLRTGKRTHKTCCESGPLRAVHFARHKWPGRLVNLDSGRLSESYLTIFHGLGEGICCPLMLPLGTLPPVKAGGMSQGAQLWGRPSLGFTSGLPVAEVSSGAGWLRGLCCSPSTGPRCQNFCSNVDGFLPQTQDPKRFGVQG